MKPLLSICIPTYNRLEILRKSLESIYNQATDEIMPLFEVVISDNSKNHECKQLEEVFGGYQNFHYHITECEGFLNSYHALTYGTGEYLKLHNNYTILMEGTLAHMIELVRENVEKKPYLFFSDGYRLKGKLLKANSFNQFMKDVSYFSSWSSGFGIWKNDFDRVKNKVDIDKYYPQTSFLISQSYKDSFILDDFNLFINQNVPGKGGYNIFRVFSVDYINLIKGAFEQGNITKDCYEYIRKSMLYKFLAVRFFKTVIARMDNFEHTGIKESILVNYSRSEYYKFVISSFWGPLRFFIREYYKTHFTQLKKQ